MKTKTFSVTFWFNIYNDHNKFLSVLQKDLSDEYKEFSVHSISNDLFSQIISGINHNAMTNFTMSQINLQYNMDNNSDVNVFKERVMNLFNVLINNGIIIRHTSIYRNDEIIDDDALKTLTKKAISSSIMSKNLVDTTLKIGAKHEDIFYKIITVSNKTKLQIPKLIDEFGRVVPMPLIPLKDTILENELINISYEINDKCLFDNSNNYSTTEFYLNKMLYLFINDFEDDFNNLIKKGKF